MCHHLVLDFVVVRLVLLQVLVLVWKVCAALGQSLVRLSLPRLAVVASVFAKTLRKVSRSGFSHYLRNHLFQTVEF